MELLLFAGIRPPQVTNLTRTGETGMGRMCRGGCNPNENLQIRRMISIISTDRSMSIPDPDSETEPASALCGGRSLYQHQQQQLSPTISGLFSDQTRKESTLSDTGNSPFGRGSVIPGIQSSMARHSHALQSTGTIHHPVSLMQSSASAASLHGSSDQTNSFFCEQFYHSPSSRMGMYYPHQPHLKAFDELL